MDASQLAALELTDLLSRVASHCEHMDPSNLINKFAAKGFAAELANRADPRAQDGEASDERDSRIQSVVDAQAALVNWACGF